MTIAFVSNTKSAGSTAATLALTIPGTAAAGDMIIAARAGWLNTITFPDEPGWTLAHQLSGGINSAVDDHTSVCRADYKEAVGGETGTVTFDASGTISGWLGGMARYTKAAGTTWSIAAGNATDNTHAANRSLNSGAFMDVAPGDVIVAWVAADTDTAPSISGTSFSMPGVTFTGTAVRSGSAGVTSGSDGNLYLFETTIATGTVNNTLSLNFNTAVLQCGPAVFVRLREVPPPPLANAGWGGEGWS